MAQHADVLVSASVVAHRALLEPSTASKILKLLSNAGLVESLRGTHGGYRLALSAETISLLDILQAIDGPFAVTECMLPEEGLCARAAWCPPRAHWQRVQTDLRKSLQSIRLSSLLQSLPQPDAPPESSIPTQRCCADGIVAC